MRMKDIEKSHEEDATDDSSSLCCLPDEIILCILSKLIDLKTLCICHLVSKRFSSIVLQVHAISFNASLLNTLSSDKTTSGEVEGGGVSKKIFTFLINCVVFKPLYLLRRMIVGSSSSRRQPPLISIFYGESFRPAVSFLSKFRGVKSLRIELPNSSHRGIDNRSLFKWKVKFGNRIESFLFLSPSTISHRKGLCVNENGEEEDEIKFINNSYRHSVHIAFQCLEDVTVRHSMLLYFIKDLPMLEVVSIVDSGKRGTLSLSREKLDEVRKWIDSASETVKPQLNRIEVPVSMSRCYVPVLDMPVSGCVMKGITLVVMGMNDLGVGIDDFVHGDEDGFEDKEDAGYSEAVMKILEKHRYRMERLV